MQQESPANPTTATPRKCDSPTETAKNYARAARANNTQRAYDADWRHFSSWLRRQGLPNSPPDPQTVGLYLAACADGVGLARDAPASPLSSAACPAFAGATASSASRSTPATATSRPFSPASAAATADRRRRRPRSSPTSCWPCWPRSTWICAAYATAPFWRSASPAACAAPKSSGSIAAPSQTEDGDRLDRDFHARAAPC